MTSFVVDLDLKPNNLVYAGVRKIQISMTAESKEQAEAFAVETMKAIVKEDVEVYCSHES